VVTAARRLGFEPPRQNDTAGAMFVFTILDPRFATDLYELDLSNHAIRRLTRFGSVVPEFYFDPSGRRLLWSEGLGDRATRVGRFAATVPSRAPHVAVDPRWRDAPRRGHDEQPAADQGPKRPAFNASNIPPSVIAGLTLLHSQLTDLTHRLSGLPQGGAFR
jgi:hypothetical protein